MAGVNGFGFRIFDGAKAATVPSTDESGNWQYLTGNKAATDIVATLERVAWSYRASRVIADAMSAIPFVLNKDGEEFDSSDDWQNRVGFLPNPKRLLWLVTAAMLLTGRAYLYREKIKGGTLKRLRYIVPGGVAPKFDTNMGLTGFNRLGKDIAIDDVVYFWYPDPSVEIGPPTSFPGSAALASASVLLNVDQFAADFFLRGAIKATLFGVPPNTPPQGKLDLENFLTQFFSGIRRAFTFKVFNAESVKPVVVGEGLEALKDAGAIARAREDISTGFGIPQDILLANSANYATANASWRKLYDLTVVPLAGIIAEHWNPQVFEPLGMQWVFKPQELAVYKEDEATNASAYGAYIAAGMKPSIAAQILGIELPAGVEYEQLDPPPAPAAPVAPPPVAEPVEPEMVEAKSPPEGHEFYGNQYSGGGGGGSAGGNQAAGITREEYKQKNPHSGGMLTGNPEAFNALPDDAIVTVFHATSRENANLFLSGKDTGIQHQAGAIQGESKLPYVGSDPVSVEGYGKVILAIQVRKDQLGKPPEARYKPSVGHALVDAGVGATMSGKPLAVMEVTDRYSRAYDALSTSSKSISTYSPPDSVRAAARRGLELREKHGHGGLTTQEAGAQGIGSGVARASNLAAGDNIPLDTIRRMAAFFARHEQNKSGGEDDAGYIAWQLWGGDAGREWVAEILQDVEADESEAAAQKAAPYILPEPVAVDLDKWRRKALKAIGNGKAAAVNFESEHIPPAMAEMLRAALVGAVTADEVKAAFAEAVKAPPEGHPFYGNQWVNFGGLTFGGGEGEAPRVVPSAAQVAANVTKSDVEFDQTKYNAADPNDPDSVSRNIRNATAQWNKELTDAERMSIQQYTGGSGPTNHALREMGFKPDEFPNSQLTARVNAIDSAIDKSPGLPFDTVLNRGFGSEDIHNAITSGTLKPGDVLEDAAYTSTSPQKSVAKSFAAKPYPVMYEIYADKGARGAFVDHTGTTFYKGEREFILPRNAPLIVMNYRMEETGGQPVAIVKVRYKK